MNYFAYGSNMSKDRMLERKINFTNRQFAKLDNYKLIFNKKAKGGDYTYANNVCVDKNVVEGILYEFPDNFISMLDKAEGYPEHYNKIQVTVSDQNNKLIIATTYIANDNKIVNGLFPTREYLGHLLKGQDLISAEYFDELSKMQTCD